jgi:hypothetical protein
MVVLMIRRAPEKAIRKPRELSKQFLEKKLKLPKTRKEANYQIKRMEKLVDAHTELSVSFSNLEKAWPRLRPSQVKLRINEINKQIRKLKHTDVALKEMGVKEQFVKPMQQIQADEVLEWMEHRPFMKLLREEKKAQNRALKLKERTDELVGLSILEDVSSPRKKLARKERAFLDKIRVRGRHHENLAKNAETAVEILREHKKSLSN